MSDAELRRLERGWDAGEAESGARLVVERLRRGLTLSAPDRKAWADMWEEMARDADIVWRDAPLVAGRTDGARLRWTWLARLDDGRWLHVVGWHECGCGWDCLVRRHVEVTSLDELAGLLSEDEVRGLLASLQAVPGSLAASPCDRRLKELERAWSAGDLAAGARLVVGRLRRGLSLAPPDHEAWRDMWEDARLNDDADRGWVTATLVAGCGSEATGRWSWLARFEHDTWLHGTGEYGCTYCGAGWFCSSDGNVERTSLAELAGRLTVDEIRGLLAVP